MTVHAGAKDVLEIAAGMEEVGKDFYRALAMASDDVRVRQFCAKAAQQEEAHMHLFRRMEQVRAAQDGSPPADERAVEALAQRARDRIVPDPGAVQKVALGGNLNNALSMALQMEKDAIAFYKEILDAMPSCADAIRGIIVQEQQHAGTLVSLAQ